MQPSILYKIHGTPDCDALQNITRYLYSIGYDMRPKTIIERLFPQNINVLPTLILNNNASLVGLNSIVNYYEQSLNVNNLLQKSIRFRQLNPNYKITESFTHKNVINV